MNRMAENEKLQMQQNAQKYKTKCSLPEKMEKINERGAIFKIFFFPAGNREISALHA
jgi:hypothetical protein